MSRSRSRANELRVGALLLVAAAVFGWLSIQIGALRGLGGSTVVTATFDDAAGLVKDAAVKVAGVEVGSVQALDVDFDRAVITLRLRSDSGIRSDVRAQIRARSLLGEKYVALEPVSQDAPLLQDGGVIEATLPSVEIDDLVAALGPVLSRVDPDDVARIVHNAAELSDRLGEEGPVLLSDSKQLLDRLNEAASIAPTIQRDVPALLGDLRRTTGQLEQTLERADTLVVKAGEVLEHVDEAGQKVPGAVDDIQQLVSKVEPGMDDLARALEQSDEAVADLRKVLDNFEGFDEEAVRRLLREEGVLVRLRPSKSKARP